MNFLGRLSHPNLVKLMGYCWEDKELLLVYEFMQKGSLENHLFGSKEQYKHNYCFNISNPHMKEFAYIHIFNKLLLVVY